MTVYCERVLAEFDECAAQLRKNLTKTLEMETPLPARDGGGLAHAAKLDNGEPSMMISFAWGEMAEEFLGVVQEVLKEHQNHAVKDQLQ